MDGGATFYYLALGATAVGTAIDIDQQRRDAHERERQLKEEKQAEELIALDQENQRLRELREANDEIGAFANGIDAFASPSLIAARQYNFKVANEDIANIRLNLATGRSGIDRQIGILRSNRSTLKTSGFLGIHGQLGSGISTGRQVFGGGP